MEYVVLHQGRVIWGPREWNPLSIEAAIEYVNKQDVMIGVEPITGVFEQDQNFTILRVETINTPQYDPLFEALEGPHYHHDVPNGITNITWSVVPDHLPYILGRIKQQVEAKRYQRETEGVDININDTVYKFPTDREQRNRLIIQSVSGEPVCWKISGTWIDLTADQIQGVVKQINQHVQKWFNWERTKVELIESCSTIDQVKQLYTTIVKED